MPAYRRRVAVLAFALLAAIQVQAHLMPAGEGALRIDADSVFAVVSIPVSALAGFDDDGDGRLNLAEMNRHREALLKQSAELLDFRGDGERPQLVFQDLLIPHLHDPAGPPTTDQVVAMQRWRWGAPVAAVSLQTTLFDRSPAPLLLRANDGRRSEAVTLTPRYTGHRFFSPAWLRLARTTTLGVPLWAWLLALASLAALAALRHARGRRETPSVQ